MSLPIELYGWCAKITEDIVTTDSSLPIAAADMAYLSSLLPAGNSVALTLRSGQTVEIVIVSAVGGGIAMRRAADGSSVSAFPKGATVRFDWAPSNMVAALQCASGKEDPLVCDVVSDDITVTREEDGCTVRLALTAALPGDAATGDVCITSCGKKYYLPRSLFSKIENDENAPAAGVYDPAKVSVTGDGCVLYAQSEAAVHKSCGTCCSTCGDKGSDGE